MAKLKKYFDNQVSIFSILEELTSKNHRPEELPGSLDIDRPFREAISGALKQCPLSRYQVAARMSELTGTDITKTMLDSWTAESKEQHRFPAVFLPAFCEAAGSAAPLELLGKRAGAFVLPGPEALRAEIQRLDEKIERTRSEKRRRIVFLKEMEGKG